jgi:hypothetical protein
MSDRYYVNIRSGVCGAHGGNGTVCYLITLVFPCQCHFSKDPYAFIDTLPTLYKLLK